jgi:hypothetical protein
MLVANALCCFSRDAAQVLLKSIICDAQEVFVSCFLMEKQQTSLLSKHNLKKS